MSYNIKGGGRLTAGDFAVIMLGTLMVGGSAAFWLVVLRGLVFERGSLNSPELLKWPAVFCAVFPIIVAVAQWLLGRRNSLERWLICTAVSGAAAGLFSAVAIMLRGGRLELATAAILLGCTLAGSAVPAGAAVLGRKAAGWIRRSAQHRRSLSWREQKQDILDIFK